MANITQGRVADRQPRLIAQVVVTPADLPVSGTEYDVFTLPKNAVLLGGGAYVKASNNTQTSSVLDVGVRAMDITADPDGLVTALDIRGGANTSELAGANALKIGKVFTTGGIVTATRTVVGTDSTAGEVVIWVEYAVLGRGLETQTP